MAIFPGLQILYPYPSQTNLGRTRFRLTALTPDQAKEAIEEPAEATQEDLESKRFKYDSEVINEILDFLTIQHKGEELNSAKEKEPVEPFQLQIICQNLEERVLKRQKDEEEPITITNKDLGGREGIENILQNYYQKQINGFEEQSAVHRLCVGLISRGANRLSLEVKDIEDRYTGINSSILQKLVDLRLLRKEPKLRSFYYELSHDSLINPILREDKLRNPDAAFKDAEKQRRFGNYQKAIEEYRQTILLDPSYASAHANLAKLLSRSGKDKEADGLLQTATECDLIEDNEKANLWHLRGTIFADKYDFKHAINHYQKALDINPNLAIVQMDLGDALLENSRGDDKKNDPYQKALEAYEKALTLDKNNPDIYLKLVRLLIEKGDFETAIDYFKQAVKVAPDSSYMILARIPEKLKDKLKGKSKDEEAVDFAREIFDLALKVKTSNSEFFYHIAKLAKKLLISGTDYISRANYISGDDDIVIPAYRSAIEINNNSENLFD